MDLFYFILGGFVIEIFIFRRELLIQRESCKIILVISVALFVLGVALHFAEMGRYSTSGALLTPLLTLWLFRFSRKVFLKRLKHEPRDTFLNWDAGLTADKFFDFMYFISATFLLMLLSVGMEKLAKAGW